jgi:hypothetical protein
MARNKGAQKRRRSKRGSRASGRIFQDTVSVEWNEANTATTVYSLNELIPSLLDRTVVVRKIVVGLVPSISTQNTNAPLICQVFVNQGDGKQLMATSPFRTLSTVNRNMFCANFGTLGRQAPEILKPRPSESEDVVLTIKFNRSPFATDKVTIRMTTHVLVFPQESIDSLSNVSMPCRPMLLSKERRLKEAAERLKNQQSDHCVDSGEPVSMPAPEPKQQA